MGNDRRDGGWQPSLSGDMLQARADVLRAIRQFMYSQGILEVETAHLIHAPVTEVHIDSFSTMFDHPGKTGRERLYLHTSPEYAMKRLLAAGSGPIYQICKVFRNGEAGKEHNPEFTMLEWYRPNYDHHALMDELNLLLAAVELPSAGKMQYAEVFRQTTQLDPHTASIAELQTCARNLGFAGNTDDRASLLDFVFSQAIAPALGKERPVIIHGFPACQAALSRLSSSRPPVAERFELFINGMEIANGFHELTDPSEQRRRFREDNRRREAAGKTVFPVDEYLLAALEAGLPDCSGLALGIDRLLMALHSCLSIKEVLAFPVERA